MEVSREKPANCAPSIEKIYIRKNLCSPLAAMPTFVNEKETTRYGCECVFVSQKDFLFLFFSFLALTLSDHRSTSLLDSNMLLNIQQSLSKLDNTILIPSSPDQVKCLFLVVILLIKNKYIINIIRILYFI